MTTPATLSDPGWAWTSLALAASVAAVPGGGRVRVRLDALTAARRLSTVPGTSARSPFVAVQGHRLANRLSVIAGVAIGVTVVGARFGPILAAAALVAVGASARLIVHRRRRRVRHGAQDAILAALRVILGELTAGARPSNALAAAADAPHLPRVIAVAAEADDAAAVLSEDPATRAVGVAWRLSEHTGLALVGVLEKVASDMVAAQDQRRTVAIALAGPRASAVLLAALPIAAIGLGAAIGAKPWTFLTDSVAGQWLLLVGIALDACGLLWISRLMRRAEST